MKVYISSAITDNPTYKEEFKAAEEKLIAAGHVVMNPVILPPGVTWAEYMHVCIPMLEVCDAIYLLKKWKGSQGAKEEKKKAERLSKLVMYEEDDNLELITSLLEAGLQIRIVGVLAKEIVELGTNFGIMESMALSYIIKAVDAGRQIVVITSGVEE